MKKHVGKILFFFFILIVGLNQSEAQENINDDLEQIESLVQKMFSSMNNKDFDALVEMTHPKVFEILPKATMKSAIKAMFEGNEDYSIELSKVIPKYKLSQIFKSNEDNLEYAFVSFNMDMKMTFHKQEFNEESKEMMIPMMKAQGMDVKFISNNTLSVLKRDSVTIILKDDTTNNEWVMVNYNPDSPLFYQILPTSLMEKAKEYNQNLILESKRNSEN